MVQYLNRSVQQTLRSVIDHRSVVDSLNRSIEPIIASRDQKAVNIFKWFRCLLCQLYKYLHNAIDLVFFYFTLAVFLIDYSSFYLTKMRSDRSQVIRYWSVSDQSVSGHWPVKLLIIVIKDYKLKKKKEPTDGLCFRKVIQFFRVRLTGFQCISKDLMSCHTQKI